MPLLSACRYCCKPCQENAWQHHKPACKKLKAATAVAAATVAAAGPLDSPTALLAAPPVGPTATAHTAGDTAAAAAGAAQRVSQGFEEAVPAVAGTGPLQVATTAAAPPGS